MKIGSKILWTLGAIMMLASCFIYRNLNHDNAVDSHSWTININGMRSFPGLAFIGFIVFMLGFVAHMATRNNGKVSAAH